MTESRPIDTLGEALPREMARVRDEIMPVYLKIGPEGEPALILMRAHLDAAAQALAEQDLPQMIRVYEALKGYEL